MNYSVHNFVKAKKKKICPTFADLKKLLIACNDLVATSRITEDENEDIKNISSKVRLDVAFKLHDVDENW